MSKKKYIFEYDKYEKEDLDPDLFRHIVSASFEKATFNGDVSLFMDPKYGYLFKLKSGGKVKIHCSEGYVAKRISRDLIGLFIETRRDKDTPKKEFIRLIKTEKKQREFVESKKSRKSLIDTLLHRNEERKGRVQQIIPLAQEGREESTDHESELPTNTHGDEPDTKDSESHPQNNLNESESDNEILERLNKISLDSENLELLLKLLSNNKVSVKLVTVIDSLDFLDETDKEKVRKILNSFSEKPEPIICPQCGYIFEDPNIRVCENCGITLD